MKKIFALSFLALATGAAHSQTVNIICSVQAEWCNMISTVYAKTTGAKVNVTMKGSGEALAQLIAEKDNPKTDIWFGGTGDPHLAAAEQGLSMEYKSPSIGQLHTWAQQQAEQSKFRTVGIYSGPLGFGYNTELLAKKKIPAPKAWSDLGGLAQSCTQRRRASGQSRLQRHGLHDGGHFGAAHGRRQSV
jgi:iron(III) transport system substrate-binding protein